MGHGSKHGKGVKSNYTHTLLIDMYMHTSSSTHHHICTCTHTLLTCRLGSDGNTKMTRPLFKIFTSLSCFHPCSVRTDTRHTHDIGRGSAQPLLAGTCHEAVMFYFTDQGEVTDQQGMCVVSSCSTSSVCVFTLLANQH